MDSVDPVVPIDNLAPEADQDSGARDSLEFHTKSGVSELFDRPADTAETPSPTGWDEVVKGASSEGDDATSEAEDTWSAESDEASDEGSESKGGWSRRRGQSRWR